MPKIVCICNTCFFLRELISTLKFFREKLICVLNIYSILFQHKSWLGKKWTFFSSWGNERPYAQHPLSKIRFFLSTQQLTLWPSKSENFQKISKFGATFERVPYHLSNLSGWNYLHFYIKGRISWEPGSINFRWGFWYFRIGFLKVVFLGTWALCDTYGRCPVVNFVFWGAPGAFCLVTVWPSYRYIFSTISARYIWVGFDLRWSEMGS